MTKRDLKRVGQAYYYRLREDGWSHADSMALVLSWLWEELCIDARSVPPVEPARKTRKKK